MKWAVIVISAGLLGLGAAAMHYRQPPTLPRAVAVAARPVAPPPTSSSVVDPIAPGRPARIDPTPRADAADWVHARPAFQSSRSAVERGGIEPCASQPVDTSGFEPWQRLSKGELLVPRQAAVDTAGEFTLVIHLHGNDPVRRELIESGQHFVLYALTLDPSQSYAPLLGGQGLAQLIAEAEQALSKRVERPARAARVILSAWSAGFVGVEAALAQPDTSRIDAVVLIDGLHAPRNDPSAFKAQLEPFVAYAKRAASGDGFFFVSHSSIDPPDFASTTECAHYLISTLDAKPLPVRRDDRFGLELVEYFSRGDFHVRGYAGNDKPDHCAQLALLRDVYEELGRRWQRSTAR
ncbi:MAG TPA: hypothetical protein VHB79_04745 [Polyangiaceae bacterium]|nr:hypothetical protein [Polyangiaceae bacterium]